MNSESAEHDPLDKVAESFLARLRAGERPTLSEYEARHPELAADIRELFPALVMMEQGRQCVEQLAAPPPDRLTVEPVPQQLGDFRLLREIGRGGMGVVYEARQESLGRHVALKVLPFNSLTQPEHLERFRREARAAARLHHTNIVPVYGVGEHRGIHYYAMQYIPGHGLDIVLEEVRRLRGRQRDGNTGPALTTTEAQARVEGASARPVEALTFLPANPAAETIAPPAPGVSSPSDDGKASGLNLQPERQYFAGVARLGAQAAEALAYAHSQGVVHRDIKPSNLLLDTSGRVWVTDFGLAKVEDSDVLTQPGAILGTVRYMAPERFQGEADERGDVYGLGITLYELLTLQPAFEQARRETLVEQITRREPPRPRNLDPRIPRDLETIVLKAMAKDPGGRYASAGKLAEDLRRFLADRPICARRTSWREQAWRWCRRNPAVASLLASVAALMLVIAGGGGWTVRDHAARDAARESEVRRALDEAKAYRSSDPAKSLAAAERASALLAGGGTDDLRREVRQTLADLEFMARAEEARLTEAAGVRDGNFDSQASEPVFAAAFAAYDLPLLDLEPEEAVRRIRASAIAPQVVSALAGWAWCTPRAADRDKLTAVLHLLADRDPTWRPVDALVTSDPAGLVRLAEDPRFLDEPPATLSSLGRELFETGRRDTAVALLRRAHQRHPGDFWINHTLAYCLSDFRAPRDEEAIGYYRAALALRPQSPGAHLNLARSLARLDRYQDAEAEAREAIRIKPDYGAAYGNLAVALDGLGRFREAEVTSREALRLNPRSPMAHQALALSLSDQGRYKEAEGEYREAIRLRPHPSWVEVAYTGLGVALDAQGRHREAEVQYREAIRLDPDAHGPYYNLGVLYQRTGRSDKARTQYREAIRRKPDYAPAHANLGILLEDHPREAEAEYREAIRLQPTSFEAYMNLGSLLNEHGRFPEAETVLRQAVRLKSDGPEAHYYLGNALAGQRRWKEAEVAQREAIRLRPNFPHALTNLGNSLYAQGQYGEAEAFLRKAVRLQPNLPEANYNLGNVLGLQGRHAEAATAYQNALRARPEYPVARHNLGFTYARLGRWREAVAEYSRGMQVPAARFNRAFAYSVLGEWDKAVADLARPDGPPPPPDDDLWFQFACLRLLQDDVPGYRLLCRQLLDRGPSTTPRTAYVASRTCMLHPEGGVSSVQGVFWAWKAVVNNPRAAWCLNNLALANYRAGQFDQAVRLCRQAQAADPHWGGDMLNVLLLAMAYERLGQHDQARQCLQTAVGWRTGVLNGTYRGEAAVPPDMHLSDWLAFQVLFREAEPLRKERR